METMTNAGKVTEHNITLTKYQNDWAATMAATMAATAAEMTTATTAATSDGIIRSTTSGQKHTGTK